MKRFNLFRGLILLTSACSVVDDFTKFNMDFNQSAIIPASSPINIPIDITSLDIETNSESIFEINDTRTNLIEEVQLASLEMTLRSPLNGDFNFLEVLKFLLLQTVFLK